MKVLLWFFYILIAITTVSLSVYSFSSGDLVLMIVNMYIFCMVSFVMVIILKMIRE